MESDGTYGRMVVYGSASFTSHGDKPNCLKLYWKYRKRPKIDPLPLPTRNKSLMGFNLIYLYEQTDMMHHMLIALQALQLKPSILVIFIIFREYMTPFTYFREKKRLGRW
jgi:alcohol dehydrogenase